MPAGSFQKVIHDRKCPFYVVIRGNSTKFFFQVQNLPVKTFCIKYLPDQLKGWAPLPKSFELVDSVTSELQIIIFFNCSSLDFLLFIIMHTVLDSFATNPFDAMNCINNIWDQFSFTI